MAVAGNATVQPKSTGVPGFDKSIDEGEDEPQVPDNPKPEGVSPEVADIDWNYTLDEENNIITLNYYIGDKENVNVYDQYKVEGSDKVYTARLLSNTAYKTSNYMFAGKEGVKTVSFSSRLDTSMCTGMAFMFYACKNLEFINFGSNFDTGSVVSMNSMFNYCPSLKNLDVSNFNTSNVTDMGSMFSNCSSLTDLDVSNFDTLNMTNMGNVFSFCTSLNNLNLSGFRTDNVTDMSAMFNGCGSLQSLDVSMFNTSNVTDMGYMFGGCYNLPNINLDNFDTSSVERMSLMFYACSSLKNINLKGFNTFNVRSMNEMFEACYNLEILDLTSFKTINVYEMNDMFKDCSKLRSVFVTEAYWATDYADTTGMFDGCRYVNEVTYGSPATAMAYTFLPEAYAAQEADVSASSNAIEIENDDTSVSYGIGDSIPYKLTATMPESIAAYKKYKLVFHDKLSAGLDYNRDSLKVFAGSTEIPAENYTVAYSEDGKSLTVSINDAKAAPWNAVPGTEIVVKYSAVLNENAEVKNRNEAWLEYSNDPKGDGTGETGPGVPDTVDVYTFEIRFDKVDKNGDPLAGAGFTLYKKDEADVFQPFGEEIKGVTRFSFKGLAAGEYKLVETTTPDGYNTMEDFVFRIDAETADGTDGKIKRITMIPVSGSAGAWTAVAADMAFESDIANYTGSTLPSTGGMGTYAFYLAGAAVVITVGTVMAAKKKEDKE